MNKSTFKYFTLLLITFVVGIILGAILYRSNQLLFFRNFFQNIIIFSQDISNRVALKGDDNKNITESIDTHYYEFTKTKYLTTSTSRYGGLDKIDNELVFFDGDGRWAILKGDHFKSMPFLELPNNKSEFIKKHRNSYGFGVLDILLIPDRNKISNLYLSSLDYDILKKCYFISVWSNIIQQEELKSNWKKVYSTQPCIASHKTATSGFAGTSSGGRLVYDGKDDLYLSTGDFYFDGVNDSRSLVRESGSDYGKIIKISIKNSHSPTTVATGLRNPQGLVHTSIGFFETEHGPQGGDELNFIPFNGRIQDYGWPLASFGVDYGKKSWPLDPLNNNHFINNYAPPLHAWLPSIGITNLIQISSTPDLNKWQGNLLIASLREQSLFRAIMDTKGGLYALEKIPVNFRIRDLIQIGNSIYLLEDKENPAVWKLSPK
jgi:hypothetical protein